MRSLCLASAITGVALALIQSPACARGSLSDADLAAKREGWYVTGLPLFNYTSDTGLGYGVRLYYFDNGSRADPLFRTTPYSNQTYIQYFATTSGWQFHTLSVDLPAVAGMSYRVRGWLTYDRNTSRNYFGEGEGSLHSLPGKAYKNYQDDLNSTEPAGPGSTAGWFNRYSLTRPGAGMQVERDLAGALKTMLGLSVQKTTVATYDGKSVSVEGKKRLQGPTLLSLASPAGSCGGWHNLARASFAYDTRDFEPAPKDGWFADITAELSGPFLGSDFGYTRETWTARHYRLLMQGVVAAMRASFAAIQGTPPFFETSTLGFLESRTEAIGGGWTARGFKENRFTGRVTTLANLELRWDAAEFSPGVQNFLFTPVAFADTGRVFNRAAGFRLAGWKTAAGGGLRIAWNRATILNLTYGRSDEDTNIFLNFGHTF